MDSPAEQAMTFVTGGPQDNFRLKVLTRQRRASKEERAAIRFWMGIAPDEKAAMQRIYGEDWLRKCLQPYIRVGSGVGLYE